MAEHPALSDFLVTFFVGNHIHSRILSEMLNSQSRSLSEEIPGLPSDFVLPFAQEASAGAILCVTNQSPDSPYTAMRNGQPYEGSAIESGDYFVFQPKGAGDPVKLLLMAVDHLRVDYQKYSLAKDTNVFIGRLPSNDISYTLSNYISREKHAAIRIDSHRNAFLEDLKRSIGIYVNGRRTHSQQLQLFDEIFLMGLSMVYLGDGIAIRRLGTASSLPPMTSAPAKAPIDPAMRPSPFIITPRILRSLEQDVIDVDPPPSPFQPDKTPAILVIGPSLTMSLVMLASVGTSLANAIAGGNLSAVISSAIMAVSMLIGSLLWPSILRSYQKRRILAEEAHRQKRYTSYIADIETDLVAKQEQTAYLLKEVLCLSPDTLCTLLDDERTKLRLWERTYEDEDFLSVRMGLGDRPFAVRLNVPRLGFELYEDNLRHLPTELSEKYSTLHDVPLTLDLRQNHSIGIIGSRKNIRNVLNGMLLHVIALHPYDEVKLVLVPSPQQASDFLSFKNVPHCWSSDQRIRFFATRPDEVHHLFHYLDEIFSMRESTDGPVPLPIPHYLLVLTDPTLVEQESLLRYLDGNPAQVGLTAIFAYGDITKLPKSCKTIIQSDDTRTGYYIKNQNANRFLPFAPDPLTLSRIHTFAEHLSALPIQRDVHTMGITDRISFLQMYQVGNVEALAIERHWDNNNSAKSLAAPIGVMAGGSVFSLDLHEAYHGCHGLVAGTTGSGKSEFLQTLILSLAIHYSPREVAFVLIDFKGGDMARPFMAKPFSPALPHLSATISNLSGNILYRALVSLHAEINSRQRLFNEAAAALRVDKLDINSYHKYYKSGRLEVPLPHLVIIIDEFAQLKTQQSDFLTELVNIAQVGRSLGIHLILATQRPSGIVDPQIMSNSRFKVCLKVAEKQDSMELLSRPDAARIKNPGRMYLQVGYDEIYTCIQSAYSGADYAPAQHYLPDEAITVEMTDNTATPIHSERLDLSQTRTDKTQLEAVVAALVALGQKKQWTAKQLWLDVLPEKVLLSSLPKGKRGLCSTTIALLDLVQTQQQKPLTLDLAKTGHIGLYGASGTGKTTFLQTLVCSMVCQYCYTPEELQIYAMDFGGRNLGYLTALPHTGAVVFADEEQKLYQLLELLQTIVEERKFVFSAHHCGTFTDYRTSCSKPLPAVLVLIDNYAGLHEKYPDISAELAALLGAGKTFGIYFVLTSSTRDGIHYRIAEHIATFLSFKMNDPIHYLDILNVRPPIVPEDISGRGITVFQREVVAFQTALAAAGESEVERITEITRQYHALSDGWSGALPLSLDAPLEDHRETPASDFRVPAPESNTPTPILQAPDTLLLGTSKSGVLSYGIALHEAYKVCICAENTEDLAHYYRALLPNIALYPDRQLVFIDTEAEPFRTAAEATPACTYLCSVDALDEFIEGWKAELNDRLSHPEAAHTPLFLVIGEFSTFFEMITDEQAAFMRKVLQYMNDPQYGICFLCGFSSSGAKNNDALFLSLVVRAEQYVLCPRCYQLAATKIETLPLLPNWKAQSCYFCQREQTAEIRW